MSRAPRCDQQAESDEACTELVGPLAHDPARERDRGNERDRGLLGEERAGHPNHRHDRPVRELRCESRQDEDDGHEILAAARPADKDRDSAQGGEGGPRDVPSAWARELSRDGAQEEDRRDQENRVRQVAPEGLVRVEQVEDAKVDLARERPVKERARVRGQLAQLKALRPPQKIIVIEEVRERERGQDEDQREDRWRDERPGRCGWPRRGAARRGAARRRWASRQATRHQR